MGCMFLYQASYTAQILMVKMVRISRIATRAKRYQVCGNTMKQGCDSSNK